MSLTANDLRAGYGANRPAVLHDVSVEIARGQVTVLAGPNGSGKSTLLRCLAGALRPQAGRITIEGVDIAALSARTLARRLAYVPQETPAPFAFTAEEIVRLAPGVREGSERYAAAITAMEIGPYQTRPLTALSGGERQRAAIARGLAQDAPYLLLDEPTAHLDLRHQIRLFQALRQRAAAGDGIAVVLHDLSQAARWADVVLLVEAGRLVASGPVRATLTAERLSAVYQTPVQVSAGTAGEISIQAAPESGPNAPPAGAM